MGNSLAGFQTNFSLFLTVLGFARLPDCQGQVDNFMQLSAAMALHL
jgi:hypothetical protein